MSYCSISYSVALLPKKLKKEKKKNLKWPEIISLSFRNSAMLPPLQTTLNNKNWRNQFQHLLWRQWRMWSLFAKIQFEMSAFSFIFYCCPKAEPKEATVIVWTYLFSLPHHACPKGESDFWGKWSLYNLEGGTFKKYKIRNANSYRALEGVHASERHESLRVRRLTVNPCILCILWLVVSFYIPFG